MCPLFPLLFPRAPWVMGRVQFCGLLTHCCYPLPEILLLCPPSMICAPYQQCASRFSLFSLILMASLSAQCCRSITRSAPATSPMPVYSCITLSLFNSVKGYMLCIFYTTAVSGTLLSVPDLNTIHCFHQQPLARTVRTPHLHKPVVLILTDPNF